MAAEPLYLLRLDIETPYVVHQPEAPPLSTMQANFWSTARTNFVGKSVHLIAASPARTFRMEAGT